MRGQGTTDCRKQRSSNKQSCALLLIEYRDTASGMSAWHEGSVAVTTGSADHHMSMQLSLSSFALPPPSPLFSPPLSTSRTPISKAAAAIYMVTQVCDRPLHARGEAGTGCHM